MDFDMARGNVQARQDGTANPAGLLRPITLAEFVICTDPISRASEVMLGHLEHECAWPRGGRAKVAQDTWGDMASESVRPERGTKRQLEVWICVYMF